jgi:hypothetical protein
VALVLAEEETLGLWLAVAAALPLTCDAVALGLEEVVTVGEELAVSSGVGVAEVQGLLVGEREGEMVEVREGECVALGEEESDSEPDVETLAEVVRVGEALSVGCGVGVNVAHALLQAE